MVDPQGHAHERGNPSVNPELRSKARNGRDRGEVAYDAAFARTTDKGRCAA